MPSLAIMSGRRRERSTKAPAKRPTSRTAVDADATRIPTCSAVAWRVSTAAIGSAVRVTTDPSSDTVCPVQSFMKSTCRHNERSVTSTTGAACHT